MISRQLQRQQTYRAQGLCVQCGAPSYYGGRHCQRCRAVRMARDRVAKGSLPWVQGVEGEKADR